MSLCNFFSKRKRESATRPSCFKRRKEREVFQKEKESREREASPKAAPVVPGMSTTSLI